MRPFDPITDCPRCHTVTAHVLTRREADPDAELIEVTTFGSAKPTYIPTGPMEPHIERECFTCGCTWVEGLPKEWQT